jgi:hypothetical protein
MRAGGATVPVYLLDYDLPENTDWDRKLTHYTQGGKAATGNDRMMAGQNH